MSPPSDASGSLVVLMPVFNDWESVALLMPRLDATLAECGPGSRVVLIDDASTEPIPDNWIQGPFENIRSIEVVRLARNLGHQRAIAIGLVHIWETLPCRAVVVMDADGEDRPEDILALVTALDRHRDRRIVFGARARRMESLTFRAFYHIYRVAHRVLTGVPVRVGNFSIVPACALRRLTVVSELWNHYAAAVFRSGLEYSMIPLARDKRLRGRSRMKFSGLVVHGMSAFAVWAEAVSVRFFLGALSVALVAAASMAVVLCIRFGTNLAIPGWTTYALASLLIIMLQSVLAAGMFAFLLISGRSATSFIPVRDTHYFILETVRVFPNP